MKTSVARAFGFKILNNMKFLFYNSGALEKRILFGRMEAKLKAYFQARNFIFSSGIIRRLCICFTNRLTAVIAAKKLKEPMISR